MGRLRVRPGSSNCSRAFFIMRKAVAAIRWRNTLPAMSLAIQKPAGLVKKSNQSTLRHCA